ncbi:FUSC family protein [Ravibacter arvi]|uniref:FUSC family protein n=1 Tax=Ravibacter arvi TaxID=2051041 RepID=A0ABP8LN11_9BACT
MYYIDGFSKFVYSQNLASGVRLTLATLIPCLIFQHYGVLDTMMPFALGTLLIGVTDNPGPHNRRRNTLLATIFFSFLSSFVTIWIQSYTWLIYIAMAVFGIFYSMIGVYGNRANSVGSIGLLVFIFTIDENITGESAYQHVLLFMAGGFWYFLIFLSLDRLRPYLPAQRLMGENFVLLGELLSVKARFYMPKPKYERLYDKMVPLQVSLKENHEVLREVLFRTRQFVKDSGNKSRTLVLMYLDSLDLFEQILNSQQDYRHLNQAFGDSKILRVFGIYITWLAEEVQHIGVAVQAGAASRSGRDLAEGFHKCELAFYRYRADRMTQENVEDFIMLKQVLLSMRDITERVKKLHLATRYEANHTEELHSLAGPDGIVPREDLNPRVLLDNLSLKSTYFRHSLRLTLALLVGYSVSLVWEFGHGYWILLTIATILKPAFGITKQRNIYRIAGTFLGVLTGFLSIYWIGNTTVLFVIMMLAMVVAYTFLKTNYFVASAGITLYVIIGFFFTNSDIIGAVLVDRVIDTLIGSAIAYVFSMFVLPSWESDNLDVTVLEALESNQGYFNAVSSVFGGGAFDLESLKHHRKEAVIALANVSEAFQKMMSEPKKQRVKLEDFHQFLATSHMLTSYMASLSSYAQNVGGKFDAAGFVPKIREINRNLDTAVTIVKRTQVDRIDVIKQALPQNEQLIQMLAAIRKEVRETGREGVENPELSRNLSDLRTIDGLFELINTLTVDIVKILNKLF